MRYGVFKDILQKRFVVLRHNTMRLDESEVRQNGTRHLSFSTVLDPDAERQFACYEAHAKYSEYLYQKTLFVAAWSCFITSLPNVT